MQTNPFPPVPEHLESLLKKWPDLIARLRSALRAVVEDPSKVTPPFEVAIWALQDTLGAFISETRSEVATAEASGDVEALRAAMEKERLLFKAYSKNGGMACLDDLFQYFQMMESRS